MDEREAEAAHERAWDLREAGAHDAAVDAMSRLLNHEVAGDLAAGILGVWRWGDGERSADVVALLRRGQDAYPSARADLAGWHRESGDETAAEAILRGGVSLDENECFLPLGNLLDETGREAEAVDIYQRGFAGGDARSAYNLALIHERHGRRTEFLEWLARGSDAGDEKAADRLAFESER